MTTNDPPSVVDSRYRISEQLGRGGMAVVFAARDLACDRDVALKRLVTSLEPNSRRRNLELFEREFHLLSQLAHPRVVQVYDFGVDDGGAYYTMELLPGRDLQRSAPLPWRQACAMARDVCSALSLVHSRRFVHRDISPRNVHVLPDGVAKLIDFGAVMPMGPTKFLVGTPPCCAPESVNLQSLDGRVDLFGLGATLYFALLGRHAYAASRFADLQEIWSHGFVRPSDAVPGIPKPLDELLLDLLRLEPDARPVSAGEVLERLAAIDARLAGEGVQAAAAYLVTPPLVGREAELARVQRRIERQPGERSRSVLIEGPPGVGRTRLIDACLLGASLTGKLVVRCDADDARSGDFGVARAIARQLFELVADVALETATPVLEQLASILPQRVTQAAPDAQSFSRPELQRALQTWLLALSRRLPFIVAVDDFHAIDEPSASLLALLEGANIPHAICLLLSAEIKATWTAPAARQFFAETTSIKLSNLSPADTERLLSSLFGDVPNVGLLANRSQALCSGNPRDLLRLAQHLIDRGVVRYAAGSWSLPAEIDSADLPSSLAQALSVRIEHLDEHARRLAQALALSPDQSFSLDECARLSAEPLRARVLGISEQLLVEDIARRVDDRLTLSRPSWVPFLRSTLRPAGELILQETLADLFEARPDEGVRAAQHWFRAGKPQHALDLLVANAESSQELTARGPEIFARYLRTLPPGWFHTFDEAIRQCDELDRPRRHKFLLLSRLSGILPMLNVFAPAHNMALFAMLKRASGLEDWDALADETDPGQRLMKALASAHDRYERASEHERVSDVKTAIQHLARAVVGAGASVTLALDLPHLRKWPRLEPLLPLSPALGVAIKLIEGIDARCAGRSLRARTVYLELLALVRQADRIGLDPSHAGYIKLGVMNGLGVLEAMRGADACFEWADEIAGNPHFEPNAVMIRLLHHVWNGNAAEADECKRKTERLRIQNTGRPMYEGQHLLGEIQAYAISGDLTRMRHARSELLPIAQRYPQWVPVLGYAEAEYARLAGDTRGALRRIEQVLSLATAGLHQIWPSAASTHVTLLLELDRVELAAERATQYVALAQRELDDVPVRLCLVQALAHARLGDAEAAKHVEDLIESMQRSGYGKLHLAHAYEVRAHIAICLRDGQAFADYAERLTALFSGRRNAALTAKSHRLWQLGNRTFNDTQTPLSATPDSQAAYGVSRIELALASCAQTTQRAQLALSILVVQSRAVAGCLFTLTEHGVICSAQSGVVTPTEGWPARVAEFIAEQREAAATTTSRTGEDEAEAHNLLDAEGRAFLPVLLCHSENGQLLITGAVLLAKPQDSVLLQPSEAATAVSRYYAGCGAMTLLTLVE